MRSAQFIDEYDTDIDAMLESPKGLLPADQAILVTMSGAEVGRVHSLDAEVVTLGRGSSCSVMFDDASLSRDHARITRHGRALVFEDLGSRNGSFLNGERVQTMPLEDGDRLRLGGTTTLRVRWVDVEEKRTLQRLYDDSVRDGLTGLFNRRHFEQRLEAEIAYSLRHGTTLSLLLLDVDHFKKVNDTFGHPGGDAVLQQLAQIIAEQVRTEDIVARYGGEELAVLARGTDLEGGAMLAERLRRKIEALAIPFGAGVIRVTVSVGVSALASSGDRSSRALASAADERLYRAKSGGRNCVVARETQSSDSRVHGL